jgi:hypothetical protein
MGKINVRRVILGGLLAGVVINMSEFVLNGIVLHKDWDDAMRSLNKPAIGGQAIGVFVGLGFLTGIVLVWMYASIRPRFGSGPGTAVYAGLMVWVLTSLFAVIGQSPTGIFPARLLLIGVVWSLVATPIASVAGAWLYKEDA